MKIYDPKEILISLHLPKSGGSSFDKVLKQWFGFGMHRHYADHVRNIAPKKVRLSLLLKKSIPQIIHGHFDKETDGVGVYEYYPGASQFISIVRDPLELQLSFYFYIRKLQSENALVWKGKKQSLEECNSWLGKSVNEHLMKSKAYWLRFFPFNLTENNYKDILEKKFIHIGITEDLQTSIDIFAKKLGKKSIKVTRENIANRNEKPSQEAVDNYMARHPLEYRIYDYAWLLNKR
jgi:hypothetical protein